VFGKQFAAKIGDKPQRGDVRRQDEAKKRRTPLQI
jgi:hypothetical protein